MAKLSTPAGIVAKIMAALKLGEEGKIGSFFNKLESDFKRQIKLIEHNLDAEDLEFDHNLSSLEEKLEDAVAAVESAWMNVTADNVATNSAQDSFKESYLYNIERAETRVKDLETDIKDLKARHERTMKDLNEQIEKYEARLTRIKG